jgi:hypothetical protein
VAEGGVASGVGDAGLTLEFWLWCTAEKKQVVLKAKFDELSQDKKTLRKAIERKRKKTSQKEKKLLPNRR